MGLLGTSNSSIVTAIDAQTAANFKATNNLLTLQTNHVEEFFEYHGEGFLMALEKLMEDTTERVVSQLLSKLKLSQGSSGEMVIHPDCLTDYNSVTQANITLDVQSLLAAAVNTEVVVQRKMARQQYLETQGFTPSMPQAQAPPQQQQYQQPYQQYQPQQGLPNAGGLNPSQISGGNPMVQANNMMQQQHQAMNNPSGYPVQPNGYDTMGNPYWLDPATGQPSYTPPGSGIGLGKMIQKGAAWAAWLA
jgi:hypothetical protein